jgi:RHS repeat-associated protein
VWRWDQAEPFGANPANDDPDGNSVAFDLPLRLPGQRYDAETGLHYNYFRDYDPSIGRYGESDPIGLQGALNLYAYVEARPLDRADTYGLAPDGCGSGPWGRPVPNYPHGYSFKNCCDWHDLCYEDCNGPDQLECDVDFCKCLHRQCDSPYYSPATRSHCHSTATLYCTAVMFSGTAVQAYRDARGKCKKSCKP